MLVTKYTNEQGVVDKVVLTSEGPEDSKKMLEFDKPAPILGAQPPIQGQPGQAKWFTDLQKMKKTA